MNRGSIQQEVILVEMYVLNARAPYSNHCFNKADLLGDNKDSHTIIIGHLNMTKTQQNDKS